MNDTTVSLRRKMAGAADLQSVVRTMKAVAAANIGQYERSVRALDDYFRTVETGLGACFRKMGPKPILPKPGRRAAPGAVVAVVFGSDQGLVGQFNDWVTHYAAKTLAPLSTQPVILAIGERIHAHLSDTGLRPASTFALPHSV